MATNTQDYTGIQKAAILLIALGPERSADIFKHLKEDEIEEKRRNEIQKYQDAKSAKDSTLCRQCKENIKKLNQEKVAVKKQIKTAADQNSIYNRAAKPYLDAKKLLIQKENYSHYEDIKARYEESKARAEQEQSAREAAARKEAEEKERYAEKMRMERKAARSKK